MKYDFETGVNRLSHGSTKWKLMNMKGFGHVNDDVFPFTVADLDLKMAPGIVNGIREEMKELTLGYNLPTDNYYESVINWMKSQHEWEIDKNWIILMPNVTSAVSIFIEAFTNKDEGIIVFEPCLFSSTIVQLERNKIDVNFDNKDNYYELDFDDLERKATDPNNTALLLFNPHNPVGRVWTKDELTKIADICISNEILILSDEIFFDFVMPGSKHTVLANLSDEISDIVVTATSPSKTFNLSGMNTANVIIKNPKLREKFSMLEEQKIYEDVPALGLIACQYAYDDCADWKDELNKLIYRNHQLVKSTFEDKLSDVKVLPLEGTCLQWIDLRALGLSYQEIDKILGDNKVFVNNGALLGPTGEGYVRVNIATPTHILKDMLDRMIQAFTNLS